jgi:glycosyltransferase involved in cell wall biosynthesis
VNEDLISKIIKVDEKYDCIYFGSLSKTKGVEDFIMVIAEIKKIKPGIKACIVGGGNAYPFSSLAEKLNCLTNIEFTGFVKSQKELFEYVKSSKVFLAPPYLERLSLTIREAMFLKVPVVAYATGGIPFINKFEENIYLVDTGDYKTMAEKTLELLNDDKKRKDLAENAHKYALNEFSLFLNVERLTSAYYKILNK